MPLPPASRPAEVPAQARPSASRPAPPPQAPPLSSSACSSPAPYIDHLGRPTMHRPPHPADTKRCLPFTFLLACRPPHVNISSALTPHSIGDSIDRVHV